MQALYISLGVLVNFIWGLAFLVPYYLKNIDPMLIVLSRYFFYGIISFFLLFLTQSHWRSLTRLHWRTAMWFAFAGNLGYYLALTSAIHYAGIALPTLIVGALPVTMMIYANFKNKEFPFSHLILPIILISSGIVGIKWFQYVDVNHHSVLQMMIGVGWAFLALCIWTWFGVANANYLKKHFTISGHTWNLAIGICCLLQVVIFFPFYLILKPAVLSYESDIVIKLVIGGCILGVIVSWLATGWWNKISRHLPTTLVGQLLVFETISSLLYGYILDQTFPKPMMLVCIIIVLLGIWLGIRASAISTKKPSDTDL